MEEQRRLQRSGQNPAPVDSPVKAVQLAGVVKRVKNKRGQAKDVKMSRTRSGPPPEQDVESDGEIDQRNQPQTLVLAAIRRFNNHRCMDRNARPDEEVVHMAPGAGSKPLPGQVRDAGSTNTIGRNQQIPGLDPCSIRRPVDRDPLRLQTARRFLPNHQVCSLRIRAFFGKVQGGKNRGRQSKPGEKNHGHPNLKRLKHRVAAKANRDSQGDQSTLRTNRKVRPPRRPRGIAHLRHQYTLDSRRDIRGSIRVLSAWLFP